MARAIYLASLWVLQAALLRDALPVLARALQRALPLGSETGAAGTVTFACAVLSVVGATIGLGYPALAAMRHAQRGPQRYLGLPRWAVGMTIAGAALAVVAEVARAFGVPANTFPSAAFGVSGASLLAAGALAAELLRRSVPLTRSHARATVLAPRRVVASVARALAGGRRSRPSS